MSKKQLSNLVVAVAAMVFIMANLVSCENKINGDHHHHHDDASNMKENHDYYLADHHHHRHLIGNKKMQVGHGVVDHVVPKRLRCSGETCSIHEQDCSGSGCWCIPAYVILGVCVGSCSY